MHRVIALADRLGLSLRAFLVLSELAIRPSGLTNVQITGIVPLGSFWRTQPGAIWRSEISSAT